MPETSRVPDPALYPVPADWADKAHMDRETYEAARIAARETPDAFWAEQAKRLDWITPPTRIKDVSFNKEDFRIRFVLAKALCQKTE